MTDLMFPRVSSAGWINLSCMGKGISKKSLTPIHSTILRCVKYLKVIVETTKMNRKMQKQESASLL
uniref:Alternative protein ALPK1 n=1 Tax=Homo sapiens TaxID=9606 RepID=L8E8U4_HUMAN|nr:alternative protein ALPK1 [Homo sapiens]